MFSSIRPFWQALLATFVLLGVFATRGGAPLVPPLDDSLIHFQYATAIAEGHPFEYWPGDGWSSGATSLLWPFLLAPAAILGLRGLGLYLWALVLGALGLAGTATLLGNFYESQGGRREIGMGTIVWCGPLIW
jgi:hypothetical protein